MNATGTREDPVWFSLCGWEQWYSPPDPSLNYLGGGSLGNSWRIAGDGSGWGPLSNCANQQADAAVYAGPGAWPDPDLLIGPEVYVGGQTDEQARAQFTLWSIFPTNLLISQNVLAWSAYALETYSNAELIAINKDPLMSPARRIAGGDLKFPCDGGGYAAATAAADCDAADPAQQWTWDAAAGTLAPRAFPGTALTATTCDGGVNGAPVALASAAQAGPCARAKTWLYNTTDSTFRAAASPQSCLDVYNWAGPVVDTWACNGGTNQRFTLTPAGTLATAADAAHGAKCVKAVAAAPASCANVWGRTLADGFALAFVNNDARAATVACDAGCFAALNVSTSVTRLAIRDLWSHADVGVITAPFSFSALVNASGSAAAFKLTPA
jgi:alpha-galactosidase